jgi:hypothetical protein
VAAPPPETPQLPGVDTAGAAARETASPPEMAAQVPETSHVVLSMQLMTAGSAMVQTAPDDTEHWHAEHARLSSTDA